MRTYVLLFLLVMAPAVQSADTSISADDRNFYLRVNSKDAICEIRKLSDGTSEATCSDSSSYVAASTRDGCLDSRGVAYCGTDVPRDAALLFNQLTCREGSSYYLSTGIGPDNNCELSNGWKRCESTDGKNYAEADCERGCLVAAGGGICCIAGTEGCPPGNEVSSE